VVWLLVRRVEDWAVNRPRYAGPRPARSHKPQLSEGPGTGSPQIRQLSMHSVKTLAFRDAHGDGRNAQTGPFRSSVCVSGSRSLPSRPVTWPAITLAPWPRPVPGAMRSAIRDARRCCWRDLGMGVRLSRGYPSISFSQGLLTRAGNATDLAPVSSTNVRAYADALAGLSVRGSPNETS
jgi:hypothetical protein